MKRTPEQKKALSEAMRKAHAAKAARAPAAARDAIFYLRKAVNADKPKGGRLTASQIYVQMALATLEGKL